MKLICLNIWGGRIGSEKLLGFFQQYKAADIICLQEVYAAPQNDYLNHAANPADVMWDARWQTEQALPEHLSLFHSQYLDDYGLQLLISRQLETVETGDFFIHKTRDYIPKEDIGRRARNLQFAEIITDQGMFTAINIHGLWNGQGKGDSPERIKQSEKIVDFLRTRTTPVIMVGDFNLLPDTESMVMLEQAGLRNLIKDIGITSTRTSLYPKEIRYADYALVSPGINVIDFHVLPDEVSDHSGLLLEFSL